MVGKQEVGSPIREVADLTALRTLTSSAVARGKWTTAPALAPATRQSAAALFHAAAGWWVFRTECCGATRMTVGRVCPFPERTGKSRPQTDTGCGSRRGVRIRAHLAAPIRHRSRRECDKHRLFSPINNLDLESAVRRHCAASPSTSTSLLTPNIDNATCGFAAVTPTEIVTVSCRIKPSAASVTFTLLVRSPIANGEIGCFSIADDASR